MSTPGLQLRTLYVLDREGRILSTREPEPVSAAFTFPGRIAEPAGTTVIEDEHLLERNFRGWVPGEIAAGRSPVVAVIEEGHPVSVCFCARRSDLAAEAGVETAQAFRGRGNASRVTAAWALAIRASYPVTAS
mgnify:CR=1 FL=1